MTSDHNIVRLSKRRPSYHIFYASRSSRPGCNRPRQLRRWDIYDDQIDHKLRKRENAFETAFAQLGDNVKDFSLLFGLKRFERRGCIQVFLESIH